METRYVMKKQFIRVLSLVLAMAMLLGLSACGGNTGTTGHVHTFSKWEVTAEPSCATFGMQKRICDDCGFTEFLQIPTLEHTAVVDEALAATCTLDGRTEGSHCSVCKQVIVEQQAIPATGHALVENAAVKETCTLDGKTEGSYCSICQLVIAEQTVIPATGHTLVVDAAVEPTCTLPGRTEGSHCGICKLVIVEQRAVPAPGHDWADASYTAPKTCRTCGVTEGTALEKPEEPTPTEPQPTEPEPVEPVNPISPLGVVRKYPQAQGIDGVEPFSNCWNGDSAIITADLSNHSALAFSLTISDQTVFSGLPASYDPEALLEWGKYPGLNMDILHKYGFTGKGAAVAYVDQALGEHELYDKINLHYVNNSKSHGSMHGPMVLSLLAGEGIGTAPEAEIYYYASAEGVDQQYLADCLYQIIEKNKLLPTGEKITMVGFSNNILEERVCVCLCMCISQCVCPSQFACLCVSLCVSLRVLLSLSQCVCLSVCVSLYAVCSLFHSVCLSHVCIFLSVCVCLSVSVCMANSQCVCPLQCLCLCVCVTHCDSHSVSLRVSPSVSISRCVCFCLIMCLSSCCGSLLSVWVLLTVYFSPCKLCVCSLSQCLCVSVCECGSHSPYSSFSP